MTDFHRIPTKPTLQASAVYPLQTFDATKNQSSITYNRFHIQNLITIELSWLLSRPSFGNLGNSSLELLLNLWFRASSDLYSFPLTGTSHLRSSISPCLDLNVAWIWGKIWALIASFMALWIWKLSVLNKTPVSCVILWFNSHDSLFNSLLKSVPVKRWPILAKVLISASRE